MNSINPSLWFFKLPVVPRRASYFSWHLQDLSASWSCFRSRDHGHGSLSSAPFCVSHVVSPRMVLFNGWAYLTDRGSAPRGAIPPRTCSVLHILDSMSATLMTPMSYSRPLVKVLAHCLVEDSPVSQSPGFLRPITRRLDENERSALIQSGAVFVWEESDHAPGLKRWTGQAIANCIAEARLRLFLDGRVWSQSRMREV